MLGAVSVKRDAQGEAPSSGALGSRVLALSDRFAGPGFGAFLLLHLGLEALRAERDGAIPQAGVEATKGFVGLLSLGIFLPFCAFAARAVAGTTARTNRPRNDHATPELRAHFVLERIGFAVLLPFACWHVFKYALPILDGTFEHNDVRVELIASLSGTTFGLPLVAAAHALGVGAASFCATREALRAVIPQRTAVRRALVALGVLSYLLGSYAVIRDASGPLFP